MSKSPTKSEVALTAALDEKGIKIKARSRAIAAFDHLLGGLINLLNVRIDRMTGQYDTETKNILRKIKEDGLAARRTLKSKEKGGALTLGVLTRDAERKIENRAKIAVGTAEILLSSGPQLGESDHEKSIDPDWMNNFTDHAEKSSSETRQKMWSNVLAREIVNPGQFSLQTLRIISEISREYAELFMELTRHRFDNILPKPPKLNGMVLHHLASLELSGLISGVNGNLQIPISEVDAEGNSFFEISPYRLVFPGNTNLSINAIMISDTGMELCEIFPPPRPIDIILKIKEYMPLGGPKLRVAHKGPSGEYIEIDLDEFARTGRITEKAM